MKKFNVLIEETLSRVVCVEANDEEHADQIVTALYNNGRIVLDAEDLNYNDGLRIGGEYTEAAEADASVDFTEDDINNVV